MRNIVIVNALTLSPYVFEKLHDSKTTLDLVKNFIKDLPEIEKIVFLLSADCKECQGFEVIRKEKWRISEFLKEIKDKAQGFDHIFYFYADCALLNSEITKRMYENHLKYFADYTFADGYPYGLTPEILKTPILDPLISLCKEEQDNLPQRDTLFELIKKDINSFDLETEISPVDLRILRVSLCADSKRNFILLKALADLNALKAEDVLKVLQEKREILRTLPRYFLIQTVEGCAQVCSYCPYPKFKGDILGKKAEMSLKNFKYIINKIKSYCEDAVLGISLWGEPSLHSEVYAMIQQACEIPGLELVIETSGLGWNTEALNSLGAQVQANCHWIVSLDAANQATYASLRGQGWEQAAATAKNLVGLFKDRVYIQAVRMQQNEDELEKFYKQWMEITDKIIIQKYDYFGAFLPQLKVTDLSPLKRFPCWHVKRDVCINIDGTIPLCREDLKIAHSLGNIFQDDLALIWEKGAEFYHLHLKENYPDICKECDEYYTFNF
jgi:spiro-SPASM protein